jgi:ketosteroid isomerase-like protein
MPGWLEDYYADVDGKDLESYLTRHTDGAVVTFGNNPPAVGKDQIGAAVGGIFAAVESTKHNLTSVYTNDGTTIAEVDAAYTLGDGRTVHVPTAVFFRRDGDLVAELRVYTDLTPVFAESENR